MIENLEGLAAVSIAGTWLVAAVSSRSGKVVFVDSSGGADAGDGTVEHPFATISHAVDNIPQGGTVYLITP